MPEIIADDGVRLHYVIDDYREPWLGEPEATVFLYHGFLKNLEHWTPFIPAIARHYRVVRFDARGAGRSGVPPENSVWSVERLLRDASNLIDALKIKKVHWVGVESGGILGLMFAADHPERTQSVACFNTPYRSPTSEDTMKDLFRCGYPSRDEAIDAMGIEKWVAKQCEQGVLVDRGDPAIVDWVAQQAARVPAFVAKEWHGVFGKTSALLADLPARVTVPVLLLAGAEHVHGCQPPLLDELRRKLQKAQEVVYIPNAAIGVQLMQPDACAAAYLKFLRSLENSNAANCP